mmetsp:Transcript_31294/g.74198  ORF Transcript_31294/g.74198 Transcript_31294/m.74198 type:complete len:313 (+) Transcript_31294:75-1013(+)
MDPLKLQENVAGDRDQGGVVETDESNREERAYVARALLMEEELQVVFRLARQKTAGSRDMNTGEEEVSERRSSTSSTPALQVSGEDAEESAALRLKRDRYSALVHDMFSPSTFRRGLTLLQVQFALMQLQSLQNEDLRLWLDLFEQQWLHERAFTSSQLRRMARLVQDASEESQLSCAKPKRSTAILGGEWEPVITCDMAIQVQPVLASRSSHSLTEQITRQNSLLSTQGHEADDPSLEIAMRWLMLMTEAQATLSISALRKAMRPIDKGRDDLLEELKALQEKQQQEERRIRELEAEAAGMGAAQAASSSG